MTSEELFPKLKERFPNGKADHKPTIGKVTINLPLKDGDTFPVWLTWQQAEYLAVSTLTGDDFKNEQFPSDWPS